MNFMRIAVVSVAAAFAMGLAGCAAVKSTLRPLEAFSEAALFTRGQDYVDQRYKPDEMNTSLRADLVAAGYQCSESARGVECARHVPTQPQCVMVWSVRIQGARVETHRAPRCMGVVSPP